MKIEIPQGRLVGWLRTVLAVVGEPPDGVDIAEWIVSRCADQAERIRAAEAVVDAAKHYCKASRACDIADESFEQLCQALDIYDRAKAGLLDESTLERSWESAKRLLAQIGYNVDELLANAGHAIDRAKAEQKDSGPDLLQQFAKARDSIADKKIRASDWLESIREQDQQAETAEAFAARFWPRQAINRQVLKMHVAERDAAIAAAARAEALRDAVRECDAFAMTAPALPICTAAANNIRTRILALLEKGGKR